VRMNLDLKISLSKLVKHSRLQNRVLVRYGVPYGALCL
jgi:hypothetical protein